MTHEKNFRIAGSIRLLAFGCASLLMLAGCGPDGKEQKAAVKPPPAPAAVAPTPPAAYQATLAEGIQFERRGYPSFVKSVAGMSGYESAGRWTEGPRAVLAFVEPLPRKFVLRLEVMGGFGPNAAKPHKVRVGEWQGEFKVGVKPETIDLAVETAQPAREIEILIAEPQSPKNLRVGDDPRMLGIFLKRVSVVSSS